MNESWVCCGHRFMLVIMKVVVRDKVLIKFYKNEKQIKIHFNSYNRKYGKKYSQK